MQIKAVKIVAKIPNTNPENLKAIGIAKIPVPSDAFNKWVSVSLSLQLKFKNLCFNSTIITMLINEKCKITLTTLDAHFVVL